jgi:TusA-related sulfurtransferase
LLKEVFKKIKKSNHLNRLVTLSPLTEMATKFHKNNGAKLIQINENTQNFEYKIEKKEIKTKRGDFSLPPSPQINTN